MLNLNDKIGQVLGYEGNTSVMNIRENIARNKQNSTGAASKTLTHKVDTSLVSSTLVVLGNDYIKTLEEGTSPELSRQRDVTRLAKNLYGWSFRKGFQFDTSKDRWWFASNSANVQQTLGSLLYRNSGRKDVYTSEAPLLLDRISQRLDGIINEIKLLS